MWSHMLSCKLLVIWFVFSGYCYWDRSEAPPCQANSLAGRHDNPMPKLTSSPRQWLCIWLLVMILLDLVPESIATLPPFSPIEGQKWFDQISSQWESQKNRFAFISFGKSRFKPPTIWDQLFMTTVSELLAINNWTTFTSPLFRWERNFARHSVLREPKVYSGNLG
jgi:hypothetical protein